MATRTIRRTWMVDEVLTDVTSAVLSDATGTYGIKKNSDSSVIVADGTAMTHSGTGIYEYSFVEPEEGVAYTAWIEIVYNGQTYRFEHDLAASATGESAVLTMTYGKLRRAIGRRVGQGRDPDAWEAGSEEALDAEDILQKAVRMVLDPPPLPGEKYAHEWSFLRPVETLTTTTPYITGTVGVAAGVVTLSGGTWPTWAAQGILTVDGATYTVASRTSNSEIVLDDTSVTVTAGETYSLGRYAYDLPVDCATVDGPMTYTAGQSIRQFQVEEYPETAILQELTYELTTGYPRKFAVRPKAIDMTANTAYELLLSPTPDGVYSFYYHYRVAIPALDDSNAYPPGGDAHAELYLEAVEAAAGYVLHDKPLYTQEFMVRLASSVSHDRKTACPEKMGQNRDFSDCPVIDWEDHRYTFNGIVRYNGYDY